MKQTIVSSITLFVILIGVYIWGSQLKVTSELETHRALKESQEQEKNESSALAFNKRLKAKADSAYVFAKQNDLDLKHAFLIDFSLHSGKYRFFIWDYEADTVIASSLCAHGVGRGDNLSSYTDIKYSNVEGSYCSSLGKYKTGIRSYSQWGINVHYKLHGLEATNDNAFRRIVVLHSYELVPKGEIFPAHLPLGYSQGCPVINDMVMRQIDNLMKEKTKDVVLWIYN